MSLFVFDFLKDTPFSLAHQIRDDRVLAIYRAMLGEDHPDTARCMYNLGNMYGNQGKYEEALSLFEKALAIWQARLGPEHPYTKRAQRDYEKTRRLMEKKEQGGQDV